MIGDIHGDLMPMLGILVHAKLITMDKTHFELLSQCYRTSDQDYKSQAFHLGGTDAAEVQLLDGLKWIGKSSVAVFLGDLLDNRRNASMDKYGVCAIAPTQQFIMKALDHLNTQAKVDKGRIVWVLGNHCMANVSPKFHLSMHDYAPRYFVQNSKLEPTSDDQNIPSNAWQTEVRTYMKKLSASAFVLITHGEGENHKPYAVGLHGGLTHKFAVESCMKKCQNSIAADKIETILGNMSLGDAKLWSDFTDPDTPLLADISMYPTWCRLGSIDKVVLADYMGVHVLFKGHDIQRDGVKKIEGTDIYATDIGMGRSFQKESTESRLGYATITMGENETPVVNIEEFTQSYGSCSESMCVRLPSSDSLAS